MKILLILCAFLLLSGFCSGPKPLKYRYCAGEWSAVCMDGPYGSRNGQWIWVCQNRYGY